jgi:hypothetical protein
MIVPKIIKFFTHKIDLAEQYWQNEIILIKMEKNRVILYLSGGQILLAAFNQKRWYVSDKSGDGRKMV